MMTEVTSPSVLFSLLNSVVLTEEHALDHKRREWAARVVWLNFTAVYQPRCQGDGDVRRARRHGYREHRPDHVRHVHVQPYPRMTVIFFSLPICQGMDMS